MIWPPGWISDTLFDGFFSLQMAFFTHSNSVLCNVPTIGYFVTARDMMGVYSVCCVANLTFALIPPENDIPKMSADELFILHTFRLWLSFIFFTTFQIAASLSMGKRLL